MEPDKMLLYYLIVKVVSYSFQLVGFQKDPLLNDATRLIGFLTRDMAWHQSHDIRLQLSEQYIAPLARL